MNRSRTAILVVGLCVRYDAVGFNARSGYAFSKPDTNSANLAVEVTTLTQGLATVSLLLGFQSF